MSAENVEKYFCKFQMENRIIALDSSTATSELAANALGCALSQIAKTLSFKLNEGAILVVAAGDVKVDNAKFKAKFNKRPKMLAADEVEPQTGHAVGGVCRFAVKQGVAVFLDVSLKRNSKVFPAAGSFNRIIGLSLAELEEYSGFKEWVDVCK